MKYSDLQNTRIQVPRFNEGSGFYSTEKSSKVMKQIKSQNSCAEKLIRSKLWSLGYRFRINNRHIEGKPDIVFNKKRIAIFIDGDFWHGYNWDIKKKGLKSNLSYWIPKIERNIQRDNEVNQLLKSKGWEVIRFWEHEILQNPDNCLNSLRNHLK